MTVALGFSVGAHSPTGAFCCGAEDVGAVSDEGVEVVVGAVVAAGVFCAGTEGDDDAGLSPVADAQGTDVAVGVLVGVVVATVVVVVVVDVTGSHDSACAGAPFPGDSAG